MFCTHMSPLQCSADTYTQACACVHTVGFYAKRYRAKQRNYRQEKRSVQRHCFVTQQVSDDSLERCITPRQKGSDTLAFSSYPIQISKALPLSLYYDTR